MEQQFYCKYPLSNNNCLLILFNLRVNKPFASIIYKSKLDFELKVKECPIFPRKNM